MKTKKLMYGIVGILATISAANAVDTATIKSACQNSDKTLWVERNQVCIPRNPCGNPNFDQYCNRDFKDLQLTGREYEAVINHFAEVKKLDCKVVPQESKWVGQDYVVCMGNDVMVFEFDDINEHYADTNDCISEGAMKALCTTMRGMFIKDEYQPRCEGVNESECYMINKYFSFGDTMTNGDPLPFAGWWEESLSCTFGCPGRFM